MGTTALAKRTFRDEVARFTPRMLDAVGGAGSDVARTRYVERQVALAALSAEKNDALKRCDPKSVGAAMIRHCATGLEIGTEAYLVPFKGECTYVPGWKGLVRLLLQSGHVRDVYARAVHQGDHFKLVQGVEERIEHEPTTGERGPLIGVYAVAKLKFGYHTFEYMPKADVDAIRMRSPGKDKEPWTQHYAEMAKKTILRRLAKRLPQSPALDAALSADERPEYAEPPVDVSDTVEVQEIAPRPATRPIAAPADYYADEQAPPAGRQDVEYDFEDDADASTPTDGGDSTSAGPAPAVQSPAESVRGGADASDVGGRTLTGGKVSDALDLNDARATRRGRSAIAEP